MYKLISADGGNGVPYTNIKLENLSNNTIVHFNEINDLKSQKDNYVGVNYYFDAGGKFRPYVNNPNLRNNQENLDLDTIKNLLNIIYNRISNDIQSSTQNELSEFRNLLNIANSTNNVQQTLIGIQNYLVGLNNKLISLELKLDSNYESMEKYLSYLQEKVDNMGISLEDYANTILDKIKGLYNPSVDFDGNYKFPRAEGNEYFGFVYNNYNIDKLKEKNKKLYKYCVFYDKEFDNTWNTIQNDYNNINGVAYDYYSLVNSDKINNIQGASRFVNDVLLKPIHVNLFSKDYEYKEKRNADGDYRPEGLYSNDAKRRIRELRDTKRKNSYIQDLSDLLLFLSNVSGFLVEGVGMEKTLANRKLDTPFEYKYYLKNSACNPDFFEDKMLIDYFCNTYLACLKISKNTVDSVVFNTYKSNVTKSGVDILFMLFRHTTVAYFATKKVFLKENNITKETLNNLLNLTPYCYMLDISNKRVLDEFFNMMKLALMMQNINKDKVESIIDTIKEDKKGID